MQASRFARAALAALGALVVGCGDNLQLTDPPVADPGPGDQRCAAQLDGAACDGGICLAGACVPSRCGDRFVDRAGGEDCDGELDCSAACRRLPCPDAGPCQLAERDEHGACVVRPLDDGARCEDRDACTAADHCEAGACVGSPVQSLAAGVRGELTSFGAAPRLDSWMEGVAAFVGPDRMVFLETASFTRSQLSLVRVDDQLTRLATATTAAGYHYDIDWTYRPTTHVVALSDRVVAVVGSAGPTSSLPSLVELFEIVDDALVSRGVTVTAAAGSSVFAAAAGKDALWLCGPGDGLSPGEILTYAFDPATVALSLAGRTTVGSCNSLAVSPDGATLLAASRGVLVADVSHNPVPGHADNTSRPALCPPSAAAGTCVLWPELRVNQVQINEHHLAIITTDNVGDLGAVRVASTRDPGAVRNIVHGGPSHAGPLGIALAGDQIFVEWWLWNDPVVWPTVEVAVHPLDAATTAPAAAMTIRDDCCGREAFTLVSFVAQGNLAVLQPWRRVVRFDPGARRLAELTGTEHGSLGAVVASADGIVATLAPYAGHRVDISDPDHPVFVDGGMDLPANSADLQLVRDRPGGALRLVDTAKGLFEAFVQRSTRERFSLYDASAGATPTTIGSFWIAGERDQKTQLGAGGHALYQLRPTGELGQQLRRFTTDRGIGLSAQELTADLDVAIDGEPVPGYPVHTLQAFGVASSGDELVVVERFYMRGFGQGVTTATWLAVGAAGVTVLARAELPDVPWAGEVAVAGDQAFLLWFDGAARLRRTGTTIAVEAVRKLVPDAKVTNPFFTRILDFDGVRAVATTHHWLTSTSPARPGEAALGNRSAVSSPPPQSQWLVEVMDRDLSVVASYETSEEVRGMTVAGTQLVFGMNSAVLVADPRCP